MFAWSTLAPGVIFGSDAAAVNRRDVRRAVDDRVPAPKLHPMGLIESLPLFPLSDVVLQPESSVPLFIFEPRYRQMTRDALAGAQQIGMVTVRPDSLAAMAGDPPIFQVGCLGRIAQVQERPDGTFHLLLIGAARFRILEELPRAGDRLYRSARVELLEDVELGSDSERERLVRSRDELIGLLTRFVRGLGAAIEDPARTLASFERLDALQLVNAIAQSIPFRPVERQQLLESESLLRRFEIANDLLRFKLAESTGGDPGPSALPN
ncbi:LON peptidase substrate-binding domain-containing protein [Myxococcota bacterium]|nr:LON peptidase substrate-binding domain-containing protein [Myxococcota bacterium]